MKHKPRIILADDHTMLLEAFQRLLEPDCEVIGTVCDGRALVELALKTNPEIIILDICMPGLNGLDAFAKLRDKLPAVRFVFLTVSEDADLAAEVIALGAMAFLLKRSAAAELIEAIRSALLGRVYITPLITGGKPLGIFLDQSVGRGVDRLTLRQREVLQLLAEGKTMKEVAGMLKLTPRTIAFHKYAIMERLGIGTSAELVQYAINKGILTSS